MSNPLDLFDLLNKVDANNRDHYSDLTPEAQKAFAPIVVERWLSSSRDKSQLLLLNATVNTMTFHLYKHPELLYKLMVASTPKGKHHYKWMPRKKKAKLTKKVDTVARYMECSQKDAIFYLNNLKMQDVLDMATEMGESADFLRDIKAEYK